VAVASVETIILTYGKASVQHSRRIEEEFPGTVQVDLYGSAEAGYLFVGDAFADNLRVVEDNAFIERSPWRPGVAEAFHNNVTTRDREAMPLLRYHAGDIVRRTPTGYRILGREKDLFTGPMVWSCRPSRSMRCCRRNSPAGIGASCRVPCSAGTFNMWPTSRRHLAWNRPWLQPWARRCG